MFPNRFKICQRIYILSIFSLYTNSLEYFTIDPRGTLLTPMAAVETELDSHKTSPPVGLITIPLLVKQTLKASLNDKYYRFPAKKTRITRLLLFR